MPRFQVLLVLLAATAACAPVARTTVPARPETRSGPIQAGTPESDDASAEVVDYLRARRLVIPVAGVPPSRIRDTFDESRDGGARRHRAIDILAPRGTPVLAADDGIVLRLSTSALGGLTVYATDPGERVVYYYAHLDAYRPGLAQGALLSKGDTIGYVGTTGNAPKDVPHLHFQVMRMPRDRRYWDGEPVNPYGLMARWLGAPSRFPGNATHVQAARRAPLRGASPHRNRAHRPSRRDGRAGAVAR